MMVNDSKHTNSEGENIDENIVEYKVYKVKPYLNSDKDPFGLTINGKSKEYVHAHQTIKGLLKKAKQFKTDIGDMKVLDVTINAGMVNSIVEVVDNTVGKGNVELKIYNPSLNKKKGATMELRKMSSFEYTHVELLKSMLIIFLDGFIAGDDVNEVLKNFKKGSVPRARVTSKLRLFNCDQCN